MYNEGAPEFVVDHGLYYPSATNYGYVCTGFESLGDWDDHHRVFGMEGQDHFIGAQTENFPYVSYYTPSYGYAQSPYNPYNPYIPGALIGADGSLVGAQQYYITSYENGESSPVYYPLVVQSGPDTFTSSMADQLIDTAAFAVNGVDASGFMRNPSSASATFTTNPGRGISNHSNPFLRVSDGLKSNGGSTKLPAAHGGLISNGLSSQASSEVLQGRGAQSIENSSNGRTFSNRNQLKVALSSGDGLSNMGSSGNGRVAVDKVRPKFPFSRIKNDVNGNPDASTEQNRGPRTNKSKTRLTVKAYSTRAGNSDANGNIIICPDQYNKDDFPLEYVNAKFFVIKSYSEDDVHKSIKYNVWSSTTNGNKKLNSAYEDARKNAECCPIFLFFSVNASGQFCGVAEMIGPVDFHKDMDFWQQGKWSGSFPVKWHIIKDVPNPNFRHIILENNEYKPVTNSRDTQEILYKKGVEMLKVFKSYVSKTSVLDDFMYYENRQKILHEERSRFLIKNYGAPLFAPALDPPRKLNISFDLPSNEDEKIAKPNDIDSPNVLNSTNGNNDNKQVFDKNTIKGDELKIGSLAISPKRTTPKHLESTIAGGGDVLTFGSMPVKVNGLAESSGFLTVGTIPLDPKLLKPNDASASTKTVTKV